MDGLAAQERPRHKRRPPNRAGMAPNGRPEAGWFLIGVSILIVSSRVAFAWAVADEADELAGGLVLERAERLAMVAGDKPRLIPLVAAESGYSENSSVNILCTVSQGHHESLTFDWFKDGQLLLAASNHGAPLGGAGESGSGPNKMDDLLLDFPAYASSSLSANPRLAPRIEKHSDHSLLRIARVQAQHSGRYTCSAKNQFGQDSSSVELMVNGNYYSSPSSPLGRRATPD